VRPRHQMPSTSNGQNDDAATANASPTTSATLSDAAPSDRTNGTVTNARAFLAVQEEFGSFDAYLWGFVGGAPKINRPRAMGDVPARTAESDGLSKDLKKRGFTFVGSTICYAFMQAVGMVNDHLVGCPSRRAGGHEKTRSRA